MHKNKFARSCFILLARVAILECYHKNVMFPVLMGRVVFF